MYTITFLHDGNSVVLGSIIVHDNEKVSYRALSRQHSEWLEQPWLQFGSIPDISIGDVFYFLNNVEPTNNLLNINSYYENVSS
jgi:hypothetical protein